MLLRANGICVKSDIYLSDFEGQKPPTFCGVDEITGDDKFCCDDSSSGIGKDSIKFQISPPDGNWLNIIKTLGHSQAGTGAIPFLISMEKMLFFESLVYTSLEIGLKWIFHPDP